MNVLIGHRFIAIKEGGVGRLVCISGEAGAGVNCATNGDPSQGRMFPRSSPPEACKTRVLGEVSRRPLSGQLGTWESILSCFEKTKLDFSGLLGEPCLHSCRSRSPLFAASFKMSLIRGNIEMKSN